MSKPDIVPPLKEKAPPVKRGWYYNQSFISKNSTPSSTVRRKGTISSSIKQLELLVLLKQQLVLPM
jgi:hypothetical protein